MAPASGSKRRAEDSDEKDDSPTFEPEVTPKRPRARESAHDGDGENDDNGADSNDGDSDNGDGKTYDENLEPFPAHAAYDDDVEELKFSLAALTTEANGVFAKAPCDTQDVRTLHGKIKDVETVPDHKRIIIGLLGDAGAGKSSLVNSLADCPGLSKALEAGRSCTYCITEFTKAVPNQRKDFSATVECYDTETIGNILSSALEDWALFYENKEDQTNGWSEEDHELYHLKAVTCLQTFRAIFSKVDFFHTDELATKMLNQLTALELDREQEMAVILDNVEMVMDGHGLVGPDGTYGRYFEADSTEKLWAELDRHVSEKSADGEPTPWPLIKKVTIGVAHSRLLDKASLVDMPGISDTNQARVDATFKHVNKCDTLLIVARMGRIVTDTTVNTLLKRFGKTFNIAVVVTGCDMGLDPACAMEMAKHGLDIDKYNALKTLAELVAAEISKLKAERSKCRSKKRAGQKLILTQQIIKAERSQLENENSRWALVAEVRNQSIISDLVASRGRHMPLKKKLKVFCVSNEHYKIHKSSEEHTKFLLSPNGTGIPQLRQHLLLLAAPRILGAIEDYIHHRFQVFLRGFELWADTKAVLTKERDALLEIVQKSQNHLDVDLEQYHHDLRKQVEAQVVGPLVQNRDKFAEHATAMLNSKIKPMHHSTIGAYMRRKGNFKKTAASVSWNTLFTEKSTENLVESWEFFLPLQVSVAEKSEEKVIAGMVDLMEKLRNEPAAVALPMKAFEEALDGRKVAVRQHFKSRQGDAQQAFRKIYLDATVENEDNFFAAAMNEAYELCKNDRGKGVKARSIGRLDAYLNLVDEHSPYTTMADSMAEGIAMGATAQTDGLNDDISAIFDQITSDLRTMTKKKTNDPSEVPVRDAIRAFLQTAGPKFDAVCKQLEEIKSRYPATN